MTRPLTSSGTTRLSSGLVVVNRPLAPGTSMPSSRMLICTGLGLPLLPRDGRGGVATLHATCNKEPWQGWSGWGLGEYMCGGS